jgi:peptidoglycan/xylan/chitin deacetylase (PgdA/CDA1 family)
MIASAETASVELKGPMVALTFDDGFQSVHSIALPEMTARGMVGTNYVTINLLGSDSAYIDTDQLHDFTNAGWEIGSHAMDHIDLTALREDELRLQLRDSYDELRRVVGDVRSFSSPFGEFNGMVIGHARQMYSSHANAYGPKDGLNSPIGFYSYNVDRIDTAHVTVAEVCTQIAALDDELYVLIFHRIAENTGGQYDISHTDFNTILDCIQETGVTTVTMSDGVSELLSRSPAIIAKGTE